MSVRAHASRTLFINAQRLPSLIRDEKQGRTRAAGMRTNGLASQYALR